MEIDPADAPHNLVEADIVEPLEARPHDLPHPMIRHQERLLPAHEDILALHEVLVVEIRLLGCVLKRAPGGEARPVLHVCLVGRAPASVTGLEGVSAADDFAFEVGGQGGVVFRQAWEWV